VGRVQLVYFIFVSFRFYFWLVGWVVFDDGFLRFGKLDGGRTFCYSIRSFSCVLSEDTSMDACLSVTVSCVDVNTLSSKWLFDGGCGDRDVDLGNQGTFLHCIFGGA
jgi:hypothetical protein